MLKVLLGLSFAVSLGLISSREGDVKEGRSDVFQLSFVEEYFLSIKDSINMYNAYNTQEAIDELSVAMDFEGKDSYSPLIVGLKNNYLIVKNNMAIGSGYLTEYELIQDGNITSPLDSRVSIDNQVTQNDFRILFNTNDYWCTLGGDSVNGRIYFEDNKSQGKIRSEVLTKDFIDYLVTLDEISLLLSGSRIFYLNNQTKVILDCEKGKGITTIYREPNGYDFIGRSGRFVLCYSSLRNAISVFDVPTNSMKLVKVKELSLVDDFFKGANVYYDNHSQSLYVGKFDLSKLVFQIKKYSINGL